MLGLYLDTLKTGDNFGSMLSKLNESTLHKDCKISWQIMCFGQKSKNKTTQ